MILLEFMIQVDEYIDMGTMVDGSLLDETRRVAIPQRMATFHQGDGRGVDLHAHQVR